MLLTILERAVYLRRLNLENSLDHDIAAGLFLATPGYELDTFGRLPSADMAQPLAHRFPETTAPEHRLTIAAFDHNQPIGLAQIALHVPTKDGAGLLLLIVPTHLRKRHIGCEIVERLSRQARRWPGISNWYLNVVENNPGGLAFWRHCGFRSVDVGTAVPGFSHRLITLTRPIKGRPVCYHHGAPEDPAAAAAQHLFARLN
jgi:hypothetical protein